jgi:hypothetical protein
MKTRVPGTGTYFNSVVFPLEKVGEARDVVPGTGRIRISRNDTLKTKGTYTNSVVSTGNLVEATGRMSRIDTQFCRFHWKGRWECIMHAG